MEIPQAQLPLPLATSVPWAPTLEPLFQASVRLAARAVGATQQHSLPRISASSAPREPTPSRKSSHLKTSAQSVLQEVTPVKKQLKALIHARIVHEELILLSLVGTLFWYACCM